MNYKEAIGKMEKVNGFLRSGEIIFDITWGNYDTTQVTVQKNNNEYQVIEKFLAHEIGGLEWFYVTKDVNVIRELLAYLGADPNLV